jgi:hypothetical protein
MEEDTSVDQGKMERSKWVEVSNTLMYMLIVGFGVVERHSYKW